MAESTTSLGPDSLVLCAGTLISTPILERIPIIARAGYDGLSIFTSDIEAAKESGVGLPKLRRRIEDAGLAVAEIDPLLLWYPSASPGPGLFSFTTEQVLEMGAALGARSVGALAMLGQPSVNELIDGFESLCREAAKVELLVHLEFVPFSAVRTLHEARSIVERAQCGNGGIMLDTWHLKRSGGSAADVEDAGGLILGVQLNDAPEQAQDDLQLETMRSRLLPGDGDADVIGVLRALRAGGSTAPLGVEVFSETFAALSASEIAQQTLHATQKVIEDSYIRD